MERIEREFLNMPPGSMSTMASPRPYHYLLDLEAPFAAGELAAAAARKATWHNERAAHWEAEATRLYQDGLPAALQGVQQIGKAMYTGSSRGQYNEQLEHAVGRLNHHRTKVEEFSNAAVAFTAMPPEYKLHIPIRIMVELDMAGYMTGAQLTEEAGL